MDMVEKCFTSFHADINGPKLDISSEYKCFSVVKKKSREIFLSNSGLINSHNILRIMNTLQRERC